MPITQESIDNWFEYHDMRGMPVPQDAMKSVRQAARTLAMTILANTPPSADQSDAIRKVREAMMTANAAIACQGR